MRKIVLLTLCLGLLAAPAWAVTYTWSDGIDHGNQGLSLTSGDLTITAKSGLLVGENPLTVADRTGTVYWGNLKTMDAGATDFYGLGVQDAGAGGSKGISGEGGDQNEALLFTFSPAYDADSIIVHLVGINVDGKNNDVINLYVSFGSGLYANVSVTAVNGEADLDLSSIPGWTTGNTFGTFAIEAIEGHFGVGSLTGDLVVPIPPTALLLGSGLLGLVGLRRFRKK